ncbi:MAG TPA: Ig-like domain-containing protein [Anaerolineales bacterium]|nr:Ig-like domain-containing protein [Anaerolineales bacterium]
MKRWQVFSLLVLALVAGLAFGYLWASPSLEGFSPADGALDVPAGAALRLTFSRPMDADSVAAHLTSQPAVKGNFTWEEDTLVFTPDQPWPSGGVVQVSLRPGARAAGFLPLPLRGAYAWAFTIGMPRLVYLYPANGPAELYALNLLNGAIRQLSDVPGSVLDFDVAPSGNEVYFNSDEGAGGTAIYRLDMQTGETTRLFGCPQALCRYPQISPQGDLLAYERTGLSPGSPPAYPQIWLLPLIRGASGEEVETGEPTLAGEAGHQTQQPVWSSDGHLAYFDASRSAFIILETARGERVMFPSQTGIPGDWSPDGESYVIPEISDEPLNDPELLPELESIPTSHLFSLNPQDGSRLNISREANVEDASPAFSPDGSLLAFTRKFLEVERWTPGRQLWLMRPDGSQARPLTQDANFNHYDLAWSPLGGRLAYVRFNKDALIEPPEIWLIDLASQDPRPSRLITGGYAPQWMP